MARSVKKQLPNLSRNQIIIFSGLFALIALVVLVIVRAAGLGVSVGSGATLSGAVTYKTDDSSADGNYLSFGGSDNPGSKLGPGEIPAYPAVPTPNGASIIEVSNHGELVAGLNNPAVVTIVLNDGNYQPDPYSFRIENKTNKQLIAKNRYGAKFEYATQNGGSAGGRQNIDMIRSDNILIRGILFNNAGGYGLKLGAYGFPPSGSNDNITIEHSIISNTGQAGVAIDSGYGSGCSSNGFGDSSQNITIQYSVIKNLGSRFGSTAFAEGIYSGSGGSCQVKDAVDGLTIRGNTFDGTGQRGAGEAIGLKTHTKNILIEDNFVKNWKIAQSTDGAAISAWIDVGQPPNTQATATAGARGIVIRNNLIDGITNDSGASASKARGIMVGQQATIEGNTIKNTVGAAIGVTLHGYSDGKLIWGFSNGNEATVNIKNNTTSNNGRGVLDHDYSQANFPITINYGGNTPELSPFSISNVTFRKQ